MTAKRSVPFNDLGRQRAWAGQAIDEAVTRVVSSGWYLAGNEVSEFERSFAEFCGAHECVGVGSGTDALELALRATGVTAGAEVVMAANAGGYAALACIAAGGSPVFAEVDPRSLSLDPTAAAAAVTPQTVAVVITHLYGIAADVAALRAAIPSGLPIIEDGSQAHGAARDGRTVGAMADLAAFSFYPTKNLGALGDAGAVTGTNPDLLQLVRRLHQYGWTERYFAADPPGRNSRLDEIQAAVLRVKLGFLPARNNERVAIADRWADAAPWPSVHRTAGAAAGGYVGHLHVVRPENRSAAAAALQAQGVATAVHFPVPDHQQPGIALHSRIAHELPHTEAACRTVLSLPCFPELRADEVDHVADVLAAIPS